MSLSLAYSPGYFAPKAPYFDNGEGLDELFVLSFYARFKFVSELLPLLQSAKDAGEEARVLTVLAAGRGGPVDMDNIGLKNNYTPRMGMMQGVTYCSLAIEVSQSALEDLSTRAQAEVLAPSCVPLSEF